MLQTKQTAAHNESQKESVDKWGEVIPFGLHSISPFDLEVFTISGSIVPWCSNVCIIER